jgi:tRNA threonylcarbamoyladenosine biosynthesis protein TsaB
VLAIELSQRSGGVALIDADGVERAISVAGGRRDRDDLGPAIAALLEDAELEAGSISTVAVDVGPGGFTGLRISVAIAQALAEVVGAAVVAVPGAVVAMASTPEVAGATGRVLVLSAAKAGTAWGTVLERHAVDVPWSIVGVPGIMAEPPAHPLTAVLADEHLDGALRAAVPDRVPIVEPRFSPIALARLVLTGGEGLPVHEDPARLQPLYPREPEAVRVWKERHADNHARGSAARPG